MTITDDVWIVGNSLNIEYDTGRTAMISQHTDDIISLFVGSPLFYQLFNDVVMIQTGLVCLKTGVI